MLSAVLPQSFRDAFTSSSAFHLLSKKFYLLQNSLTRSKRYQVQYVVKNDNTDNPGAYVTTSFSDFFNKNIHNMQYVDTCKYDHLNDTTLDDYGIFFFNDTDIYYLSYYNFNITNIQYIYTTFLKDHIHFKPGDVLSFFPRKYSYKNHGIYVFDNTISNFIELDYSFTNSGSVPSHLIKYLSYNDELDYENITHPDYFNKFLLYPCYKCNHLNLNLNINETKCENPYDCKYIQYPKYDVSFYGPIDSYDKYTRFDVLFGNYTNIKFVTNEDFWKDMVTIYR